MFRGSRLNPGSRWTSSGVLLWPWCSFADQTSAISWGSVCRMALWVFTWEDQKCLMFYCSSCWQSLFCSDLQSDARGDRRARRRPRRSSYHRDQRSERGGHTSREDRSHPVKRCGEVNHRRSQWTLSPPNTDFSVISLLYTRGRYYTSLNESRKCRSKTQMRKTQKRAMSYVSICIWKTMPSSTLTAYTWKPPNVTEWNVNPESGKGQCKLWEYWWKPSTASLLW